MNGYSTGRSGGLLLTTGKPGAGSSFGISGGTNFTVKEGLTVTSVDSDGNKLSWRLQVSGKTDTTNALMTQYKDVSGNWITSQAFVARDQQIT